MTTKDESTSADAPPAETRSIRMSVAVDATPEQVWKALTDPEELARWFAVRAEGTPGPDGRLMFSWGPDAEWWTTVTAWVPMEHVQYTDDAMPGAPPPLVVDWYITTEKGKTVVRGVHSGFGAGADWDAMYDSVEGGWTYFMRNLRHYLERHPGTARDMVFVRRKTSTPQGTVWQRLTSAEGLSLQRERMRFAGSDGVVEHAKPGERVWGTLAGLGDSLLFVEFEGRGESYSLGIWLSTYGLPGSRVSELQREMDSLADRLLTS